MKHPRALAITLKLLAVLEAACFAALVVPNGWYDEWHRWLGLGPMPIDATTLYAFRASAYVFGAHGVLDWYLATDVTRFRPIIVVTGWTYLIAAPVFLAMGAAVGMPWFWYLLDGSTCLAGGVAVLHFARPTTASPH